mmetsp:Transcript_45770/g.62351  ORF Transcript_45770/g.62351 Transcript_45770/m.62351 type:complete len:90 (+) Transcript_45770:274-543(+)
MTSNNMTNDYTHHHHHPKESNRIAMTMHADVADVVDVVDVVGAVDVAYREVTSQGPMFDHGLMDGLLKKGVSVPTASNTIKRWGEQSGG